MRSQLKKRLRSILETGNFKEGIDLEKKYPVAFAQVKKVYEGKLKSKMKA